jgi:hypothetical protein
MALSKDTPGKPLGGHWVDYPMAASATIYEGGFVGDNAAGYARALTAGDPFLGIAQHGNVDATATAGGTWTRLRTGTWRQEFALAGAITDGGKIVYASDDATLTLTAGTNTPVGRVVRYVTAALMEIEFTTNVGTLGLIATTNDLQIKSNDDLTLTPGKLAADAVNIQGWDIDHTTAVTVIAVKSHATDPTLTIAAPGGATVTAAVVQNGTLTLSNTAGTGAGAIAAVALQDIAITAGNDLTLNAGHVAADKVVLTGYDIDHSTDINVVSVAAHATDPTLTITAPGGATVTANTLITGTLTQNGTLTISNTAGTGAGAVGTVALQDLGITAGNDLALNAGLVAADKVTITGYDIDGSTRPALVTVSAHATIPTLLLGGDPAATAVAFFDSTPCTQRAAITITTTDTSASVTNGVVESILVALRAIGIINT